MHSDFSVKWGMRLGLFRDKDAFAAHAGRLSFVVLPAHIVALAPSGVSGFLAGPIAGIPFWIDPYTAAFCLPWESLLADRKLPAKGPRRSLLKLAEAYGEPFVGSLDRRESLDFDAVDRHVETIGAAAVRFQLGVLRSDLEEDAEFFGIDTAGMQPSVLMAPYFPIAPDERKPWVEVNLRLYAAAAKQAGRLALMPVVLLDRTMLEDRRTVAEIADAFRTCSASVYGVWVDGLDESECASLSLTNLLHLVSGWARTVGSSSTCTGDTSRVC